MGSTNFSTFGFANSIPPFCEASVKRIPFIYMKFRHLSENPTT
jgi:hypothetical protein